MFHRPWTKPGHGTLVVSHVKMALLAVCLICLTAAPVVTLAQDPPTPPAAPVGLTCAADGPFVSEVLLNWTNSEPYDQIAVRRDGILLEFISGSFTSYIDFDVPASFHTYSVHGMQTGTGGQAEGDGVSCTVQLFPPPLEAPLEVPAALNFLPIPLPENLFDFVADPDAAILLGKALFWDMQAGSDGIVACATCHYHAGADNRRTHQLYNGFNEVFDLSEVNHTVTAQDFPLHKLLDPDNHQSTVLRSVDDTLASSGILATDFVSLIENSDQEILTVTNNPDTIKVNSDGSVIQLRNTTVRNTPTTINSIHFLESFWDGRASFFFNGRDNWGARNKDAFVLKVQPDGNVGPESILLDRASLASQATAPIVSPLEMSGHGRDLLRVGKKLLALQPLAKQKVHPNDSVLGAFRDDTDGMGLNISYAELIEQAFVADWWNSAQLVNEEFLPLTDPVSGDPLTDPENLPAGITGDVFNMKEANFSLYWGLAIMLYEATLISDDSPFDQWRRALRDPADPTGDIDALTPLQVEGVGVFTASTCLFCHPTALFSSANTSKINIVLEPEASDLEALLERMPMMDMQLSVYDGGFYNLAVTPTFEDIGRGGSDPFGHKLSIAAAQQDIVSMDPNSPEYHNYMPWADNVLIMSPPVALWEDVSTEGAFKTPSLRNVELTGPYFHNGSVATLDQVVDFYTRGGNFPTENFTNLAPEIIPLGFLAGNADRKEAMVAFLDSLTDDRVRWERAPFDHPEIIVPEGAESLANGDVSFDPATGVAIDRFKTIPAVGAEGRSVEVDTQGRPLDPLTAFLQPGSIHDLTCSMGVDDAVELTWSVPVYPDDIATQIHVYRNGQELGVTSPFEDTFTDLGAPPGEHVYSLRGKDAHFGLETTCDLTIAPPPPLAANATITGAQVTIEWINPWPYSSLDIYRDGALLAGNIPGASQLYVDGGVSSGLHIYQLVGNIESNTPGVLISSDAVSLTVERAPLAPVILGCTTPGALDVQIDWQNLEPYTTIFITRAGSLIDSVDGASSSYTDAQSLPGITSYSIQAIAGDVFSDSVSCTVQRAPLPITDLVCDNVAGDGVLGWSNSELWDEAHVSRDGSLIAILTSGESSFIDTILGTSGAGLHVYEIRTFADGVPGLSTSCSTLVNPESVVLFECNAIDQGVLLTWTNMDSYDTVELTRNGAAFATLPGQSNSYLDDVASSGLVEYTITAVVDGASSIARECGVSIPPAPINNLTCTTVVEGVSLAWVNGDNYDEIDILRNGVLLTTVLGDVTQYTDTNAVGGAAQYAVIPSAQSVPGAVSEVCEGLFPPDPVISLEVQILDNCTGDAVVSWFNTGLYDWLRLEVDGNPVVTLPGILNQVNITLASSGLRSVSVISIIDDMESEPVTVTVDMPEDGATAPTDVTATVNADSCETMVTWIGHGDYLAIQVLLEGVEVATATAQDTFVMVDLPGAGSFTIQVNATSSCGADLAGSTTEATCEPRFRRGDHNGDGSLDISDALSLLGYIFSNGPSNCMDAADANDDGGVDVSDAVRVLLHLFGNTGPLPAPHGVCGSDPTADDLSCDFELGCP
ncbi:MAG: cytochrome c peroxidase [Planctomycetota bacterium]|nr:cytochrome c peroxidase [Planctomycetota bacterium]